MIAPSRGWTFASTGPPGVVLEVDDCFDVDGDVTVVSPPPHAEVQMTISTMKPCLKIVINCLQGEIRVLIHRPSVRSRELLDRSVSVSNSPSGGRAIGITFTPWLR